MCKSQSRVSGDTLTTQDAAADTALHVGECIMNGGNNCFAPEYVKQQTASQANPETRITYYNYNSYGKPLYISKDNADKVVYLWSYNHQYPIAEIINATYEQVKAALGYTSDSQVEALAAQTAPNVNTISALLRTYFKDASVLVTTYTYKPLVGMTSDTDSRGVITYYEYDSFGRLKRTYLIENGIEKTLQWNDYHYRNE
ncbi:hypothetical protein FACS1894182_04580 [Bacteroidia bacterium]|nr:hypothetical protein FACS1894182_04580 [Bacteroidia bacterium]